MEKFGMATELVEVVSNLNAGIWGQNDTSHKSTSSWKSPELNSLHLPNRAPV
jgi:hypothetical protein